VDASAAQKQPVTKTCLQCGAILPYGISACGFCDSVYQTKIAAPERASVLSPCDIDAIDLQDESCPVGAIHLSSVGLLTEEDAVAVEQAELRSAWRGEVANRVEAYRLRRRTFSPDASQSRLPFAEPVTPAANVTKTMQPPARAAVELALKELSPKDSDDFSFTIAIGRIVTEPKAPDGRLMIDVSNPVDAGHSQTAISEERERDHQGLYPVASLGERRLAGTIDAACLLFASGGFLTLFGSLGGHFTFSKLSAAVCATALAVVYFQYFALFTIFGGTTPGMMFRGLQVVSFSGDAPSPRQMLLRSAGYMVSAGTCFMGFIWAMWDEDELTWHDRFSRTFLSSAETYTEIESHTAAHPQ
jgi:uncharacterized RDD family membrane protein YckC